MSGEPTKVTMTPFEAELDHGFRKDTIASFAIGGEVVHARYKGCEEDEIRAPSFLWRAFRPWTWFRKYEGYMVTLNFEGVGADEYEEQERTKGIADEV